MPMPLHWLPHRMDFAPVNMALDSALLARARGLQAVQLRFYGWTEPALTFGYGQRWAEVAARLSPPPGGAAPRLVRRTTGGGIVDHRADFTYALALPANHPAARSSPRGFYCRLHEALANALRSLGVACALAPCPAPGAGPSGAGASACFDRPEPSDVVLPGGSKLAGAALRRTPDGVLAQGSLDRRLLPPELAVGDLAGACAASWAEAFACAPPQTESDWPADLDPGALAPRFASIEWNQRR